jgi:cyclopropane-fatty-acyl-phospholipid synthase
VSAIAALIHRAETLPAPDPIRRAAVDWLVGRQRKTLMRSAPDAEADFAQDMSTRVIAEHTDAANQQHYELPPRFFELVLGPRLKYSSALYPSGSETLGQAEEIALAETCDHADLKDGQDILELGCGWGSLTLWMASRYPNARITAVSNSNGQREHITAAAARQGLSNVTVITADANVFAPSGQFDRVVSVEMFEHMANWEALLGRVRGWLKPDGRVFIHVFSHRATPYRFTTDDPDDWIGQYFFTGGFMPSHGLMKRFPQTLAVERDWQWNGRHYEKTALDWLANFDRHDEEIRGLMADVYGPDAALWRRRWRLFFLATAGLFGFRKGEEWGVSHYRMKAPA